VPRLFLPADRVAGEQVTLQAEDHHYVAKVLRLQAGDRLVIFDGVGTEIEGRVERVGAKASLVALLARRTVVVRGAVITLLQSIPRGDRMDLVVQKATELGVARIVPVIAGRSVARPDGAGTRVRRWQTIAAEAARQSGRADVPVVEAPQTLDLALAGAPPGTRLVLWEGEHARPLRLVLTGAEAEVTLLVGPEGGFPADEIERCRAAGFAAVGLGPRILRVETAALVAVALVQAAAGGLD
jgi:16S rRNA (uracil1498-N3)-methyltransferase